MVTLKEERETVTPVWIKGALTMAAIVVAMAIGAILYFKAPGSVRTSPTGAHEPMTSSDKTNAPHFSPTRDVLPPKYPAGTDAARIMSPARTLSQPGAVMDPNRGTVGGPADAPPRSIPGQGDTPPPAQSN